MAAPDMSLLTAAADFDSVVAVVLVVMVAWLYVQVLVFGVSVVLRAVRSDDFSSDGFTSDDYYSERYSGEGYTDSSGNWIKDEPLAGIDDDIRRASK